MAEESAAESVGPRSGDPASDAASPDPRLPRVTIRFCTQCKWMLRAAYVSYPLTRHPPLYIYIRQTRLLLLSNTHPPCPLVPSSTPPPPCPLLTRERERDTHTRRSSRRSSCRPSRRHSARWRCSRRRGAPSSSSCSSPAPPPPPPPTIPRHHHHQHQHQHRRRRRRRRRRLPRHGTMCSGTARSTAGSPRPRS